jgi:hypothetical protein
MHAKVLTAATVLSALPALVLNLPPSSAEDRAEPTGHTPSE